MLVYCVRSIRQVISICPYISNFHFSAYRLNFVSLNLPPACGAFEAHSLDLQLTVPLSAIKLFNLKSIKSARQTLMQLGVCENTISGYGNLPENPVFREKKELVKVIPKVNAL
ncbi:hypothetical protein NPIL_477821 [Nephila pilipes]|uniref:Uncharacterized protein n=1 Tax=Nephila pilipes TaxID=299642 RepID=A0A8X6PU56_NEPPI|nr:hypothetical protein NPIL_477821 [Nephila pilipes]